MVAYNFQMRFAGAIESRRKRHTIRKNGRRRHARAGESIQLYTGMRTRSCRKLIDPDPICDGAFPVEIVVDVEALRSVMVGGVAVRSLDAFARSDGFKSAADMHAFWLDFHGVGLFQGTLIEWKEPAGVASS